jgi:uncharacterized protein with von Willebrand factor type A (vWA) domain
VTSKKTFVATLEIKLIVITDGQNDALLDAMDAVARLKNIESAKVVSVSPLVEDRR